MIELKEWWDVEYKILPEEDIKYSKVVLFTIKNHSPKIRKFKIGVKSVQLKNELNILKVKMFLDVYQSPLVVEIGKYKKEEIGIAIPKLSIPEDDGKIVFYIRNEDTKEEKEIPIYL